MGARAVDVQATVRAVAQQASANLGAEVAILHFGSGRYYALEGVGARIWALLQQSTTVGALRDTLLAEYDVTPDRLERDLRALLERLEAEQLIDVRRDGAA